MRVALISDLHGNEVALEAVLDDIARAGADRVVCLGDVATLGPRPGAVLGRLRDLGCACIMGNHDEFLLDPALIRSYTEAQVVVDAVDWCRERLTPDELAFVGRFQRQLEIDSDGPGGPDGQGARLLLFHGSPRSHMEDLLATTPPDELDVRLDGRCATVMAGGHTHIQMLRQHRGALLVNPGSVGMPFKEYVSGRAPTVLPYAEYALVTAGGGAVDVALRRVPLDRGALHGVVAASDNPLRDMLLQAYA